MEKKYMFLMLWIYSLFLVFQSSTLKKKNVYTMLKWCLVIWRDIGNCTFFEMDSFIRVPEIIAERLKISALQIDLKHCFCCIELNYVYLIDTGSTNWIVPEGRRNVFQVAHFCYSRKGPIHFLLKIQCVSNLGKGNLNDRNIQWWLMACAKVRGLVPKRIPN